MIWRSWKLNVFFLYRIRRASARNISTYFQVFWHTTKAPFFKEAVSMPPPIPSLPAENNDIAEQPPRRVLASRRLLFPRMVCRVLIPAPEGRGGRASKRGEVTASVGRRLQVAELFCGNRRFHPSQPFAKSKITSCTNSVIIALFVSRGGGRRLNFWTGRT
jgi:hypothetical protein